MDFRKESFRYAVKDIKKNIFQNFNYKIMDIYKANHIKIKWNSIFRDDGNN